MADCSMQEDEHTKGIPQPTVKVLSLSENPTDDITKFHLHSEISMSACLPADAVGNISGMIVNEERLNSLHEKILNWNSDRRITWEPGAQCVQTVEEIRRMRESIRCLPLDGCQEKNELLQRVHSILQMAMSKLEEEFGCILRENRQTLEPELFSFQSSYGDMSLVESIVSEGDEYPSKDTQVRPQGDNARGFEQYNTIDLVHPNVIPHLKCIAEVMFASGYDAECCRAYIRVRNDALRECLLMLEVENLSTKDVLKMEWSCLNSKIKKWVQAVKIAAFVYLTSEKSLADKVFGISGSVSQTCFIEVSKSLILQHFLSFGEAVAIRNHSPEEIFLILDMYDAFVGLLHNIDELFSDDACSFISAEGHKVVSGLGESVRRSINEFRNALRTHESFNPFAGGGLHHLSRYVMNYLKALTGYSDTLNFLLGAGADDHSSSSSNMNTAVKDNSEGSASSVSPMARYLQSTLSILETNLESESELFTDVSQQQFFLMNNICYMTQEVKDSDLRYLLGENWLRKHYRKFQQHAINYERASWSPVLSFLSRGGICNPESGLAYEAMLKVRLQCFNLAFEEIYRTQTAWLIPNVKLRDVLRISISSKVLEAYQSFLERYTNGSIAYRQTIGSIAYSVEDLEEFIWHLFAGSPKLLLSSLSLEEEFSAILIANKQPWKPENLPFHLNKMSFIDWRAPADDVPFKGTKLKPQRDYTGGLEEYTINLVHPNVIPHLKCISELMFATGYELECCEAYTRIRKHALQECFLVLKVENLSIEDVLQMEWSSLNSKIKKWVRAMKIFVCVYLASEKSLADQVFGLLGSVSQTCFIEASESFILQLLSFAGAVTIRNYSPEQIFLVLDMYDGFVGLIPHIDVSFSNEAFSFVSTEAHKVITRLGQSVRRTIDEFRNALQTNESSAPFSGSGVHHLTKYVMNYLKDLTGYSDALNCLLKGDGDYHLSSASHVNATVEDYTERCCSVSPMAQCLQSMLSIFESNLERMSLLYTEVSQQQFFLMNNICYMAQQVKDSKLRPFLGGNWMQKHRVKFQMHAVNYERASWSPILSFLTDDLMSNQESDSVHKAILKVRLQCFNLSFEEIYATQTMWSIPDVNLCDCLRISISSQVLQAYQSFLERYSFQLAGDMHTDSPIKYSMEDLEEFLWDFFASSPRSLHKSRSLVEEFGLVLIENKLPLEPENLPWQSSRGDMSFVDSIASLDDEPSKGTKVRPRRDEMEGLEECIIDLVHPNVIAHLKCIAEVMLATGYGAKCCEAYINIRKDALWKCFLVLEVEMFSIMDVLQMNWIDRGFLSLKIKKWVRAAQMFVCTYLASEKSLADHVFGLSGLAGQTCFVEASKNLILQQFLSFGEVFAIKNYSPEQIFLILGVYDGLVRLLPNIDVLFADEACSYISTEAHKVVSRLGEIVRRSFNEFGNGFRANESPTPFAGGGVHNLTIYVMNFLKALTGYSDSLNFLLEGGGDNHLPASSNVKISVEGASEWISSPTVSPMAQFLQSVLSILESNLEDKSQLYTDIALQQFFLMNNICYMEQNVKDSKLRPFLGESWLRKHYGKYKLHAVNYEMASWSPVLSFLRDEGICNPESSGSVHKGILKVRLQCFNLAFEEIHKIQTAWLIPDVNLRDCLRISISAKVLQAYETFLGRFSFQLAGDRHAEDYIKYSAEDLAEFVWDFFAGSSRSLHRCCSLEEEFSRILIENKQPLKLENLNFQSSDDGMPFVDLFASMDDETSVGTQVRTQRNNIRALEEYIIDLVHPNVIPHLKCIAEIMFASCFDAECCQNFVNIRKDALQECLLVLEVEKLSIEDVLQMDWSSLNFKIKKWIQAAEIFICVCLASEKRLVYEVFGDFGSVGQICFAKASKSSILQLLSFGEAIAIRNHSPEKILLILYMCDGFVNLLPHIDALFSDDAGSSVCTEAHELVCGLAESVVRTLTYFRKAVETNDLSTPLAGGGVHHLTSYVINYLKALIDYSEILNFLLEVGGDDHSPSSSSNVNRALDDDCKSNSSCTVSPAAQFIQRIISVLELNLRRKSQLYADVSLQHFFLMNNIYYIAQKVNDSELEPLLGDKWMRKQDGKFQQHALNYERTSWCLLLSFLKVEWIEKKSRLRERLRRFNLAFEKTYRTQREWLVHSDQLRDDLRISISSKVLLAYRPFLGWSSNHLEHRNIKYSAEDLQEFLLDLFEESPKPR